MSCDVPSCDEMSSVVKWRDAMGRGLPSLWCDVAGCDVTLRGSKWLCDVGNWKMIWSVLQRNTSTAQYYKVLLRTTQFYKVLLRTTQFYKVLLRTSQHYKLRQCTTLHYTLHSTTTHYKVLLTPYYKVWLRTTKYYKDTTPYDKASICLIDATHETPSTLREATGVTFELHQILRLPRKMILMIDPRDISNVIYIAQSSTSHPPTSPNIVPATKNDSHDWSSSPMKSHSHCAEHQDSPSNITKYCACHEKWLSWLILLTFETSINNARSTKKHPLTSPNIVPATKKDSHVSFTMRGARLTLQRDIPKYEWKKMKRHLLWPTMREWSEHDPNMNWPSRTPPLRRAYFSRFGDAFCMRSGYLPKFHQMLRLPRKFTLQHHQMLRLLWKVRLQRHRLLCLPPKTTLMIDPPHIWNGIYIGRSNSLQRHQILRLPRKWHSKSPKFMKKTCWKRMKRHLQFTMADNARLIRAWSEHELWSSRSHRSPSLLFTLWRRSLYRKMRHFVLRLSTVISPNAAPARKSDTPTSPNVREKCHCNITKCYHEKWDSNVTKYCACHEKWLSWLILLRQMRCAMCDGRCEWCDWCHLTELLLNCDLREQRQDRTVTLLNCYIRDWAITWLNCYLSELLLQCFFAIFKPP